MDEVGDTVKMAVWQTGDQEVSYRHTREHETYRAHAGVETDGRL